jgi:hypothetical protein
MKMFDLSVCPTTSPKVYSFTPLVALSKAFRNTTTKTVDILHQLSPTLNAFTRPRLIAVPNTLNGQPTGQQHIYAPVALQPIICMHTASHPIRFSNGRTPYTSKQSII